MMPGVVVGAEAGEFAPTAPAGGVAGAHGDVVGLAVVGVVDGDGGSSVVDGGG